jgi:hypothetical protein
MDPAFHPFVILLWVGAVNETSSYVLRQFNLDFNAWFRIVYTLLEFYLICWQFKKWGLFQRGKNLVLLLQILLTMVWIWGKLIHPNYKFFDSYFTIADDYIILLLCISMINKLIFNSRELLVRNPVFIICMGYLIYFAYSAFTESFWIHGNLTEFSFRVYLIMYYINMLQNILFAIAICMIPPRPRFILPSLSPA